MTLPEQAAVLLEAAEHKVLRPEDVVQWADEVITAMESPPLWLVDLSTLRSPYLADLLTILRQQVVGRLPLRRRIQVVVMARWAGLLTLSEPVGKLWDMVFATPEGPGEEGLDERLRDALVECECRDGYALTDPGLLDRFETLFHDYSHDADDIGALLPKRQSGRGLTDQRN